MTRIRPLLFVTTTSFALALGCAAPGDDGDATAPSAPSPPPKVCAEASPSVATIGFDQGEIGALVAEDGVLYAGARSLKPGERGAVWRVTFDGEAPRRVSDGFVGGRLALRADRVLHSEPAEPQPFGTLVASDLAGTERTVLDGPKVLWGEFAVARDDAFFFGGAPEEVALWSYGRDGTVSRLAEATPGSLFSNGEDLFQAYVPSASNVVRVRRFDRPSAAFVDVTSFDVKAQQIAGVDRQSLFLFDVASRKIREVNLSSGREGRTLGRDLDGTRASMHVTNDAIWAVEAAPGVPRRLVRIDLTFGRQQAAAELDDAEHIHAFASDACYVYVAVEGGRAIGRAPRAFD